jgi:NhaP-type Na+/H+ or K+/H+ antiporter
MQSFETTLIVLGLLLVAGALASGLARRSFLSLTAVFVLVGLALGDGGFGLLDFDPRSAFVEQLAVVALVIILFRDGLEVDAEMLQKEWHLPLRKLALAMPITAAIVALVTHVVTDLSWTQAFLIGALLSPTDPVLSSSVVTNPRIPRRIRHSLNLESGLNDGLALPPVLALIAALRVGGDDDFVWYEFVAQDLALGVLYGVAVGYLASKLLPRDDGSLSTGIPAHQRSLYALGVAFATYGLTVAPPHGNGFIAVFVCAMTLGVRRPDVRLYFERRAEDIIEIVKLGIFVVFGSLLTFGGLFHDGFATVAIVVATLLVARPVAVFAALAGTGTDRFTTAFMAWFGPKGVATMTFSLLVLSSGIPDAGRIFDIAALTVLVSVVAHGLTDTPGSEWMARRAQRDEPRDGATRAAPPAPAR